MKWIISCARSCDYLTTYSRRHLRHRQVTNRFRQLSTIAYITVLLYGRCNRTQIRQVGQSKMERYRARKNRCPRISGNQNFRRIGPFDLLSIGKHTCRNALQDTKDHLDWWICRWPILTRASHPLHLTSPTMTFPNSCFSVFCGACECTSVNQGHPANSKESEKPDALVVHHRESPRFCF